MAMAEEFVGMLRCPIGGAPLVAADAASLARLNARLARGRVRLAGGGDATGTLSAALLAEDGSWAYRVDRGVPTLLPELAIPADRRGGGGPAYRRPADASTDERWAALARAWPELRPPVRPDPEDVAALERIVGERAGAGARALVLGVTPELAAMRWPAGARVLALDFSEAMIAMVWRAPGHVPALVARADWTVMPVRDGVCDVVVGDGNLTSLSYPSEYAALVRELRRVLRGEGVVVLRLFARPERPEPLDAVFADLRAGRIESPAVLPWRIAMALHGTLAEGVRAAAVWETWCERVPRHEALFAALGWPEQAIASLAWARGQEYVMRFPTVAEVAELMARGGLAQEATVVPTYQDGACYPTVVFAPERRRAGTGRSR